MGAVTGWHGQILCKVKTGSACVCVAKGCKSNWEQRVLFSLPPGPFLVSDARVP